MTILRFIQLGLLEEDGVNIGKEDTDKERVRREKKYYRHRRKEEMNDVTPN